MFSCSNEKLDSNENTLTYSKPELEVVGNKLKFQNNESLKNFLDYNDTEIITEKIDKLKDGGFQPLKPVIDLKDVNAVEEYLKQKKSKLSKKGLLYTLKGDDDDEVDLDDELISDPKFASVLNEEREIYVGDSLYIYTTNGTYITSIEDEPYLRDYLEELESGITSKSDYWVTHLILKYL